MLGGFRATPFPRLIFWFFFKGFSKETVPSTTSHYRACTNYFPVLLSSTKLAQSTSQYYFVPQVHFPVLLRTTKLAQSTSQYYFVLQSLHRALPSSTSYDSIRQHHLDDASTQPFHCKLQAWITKHNGTARWICLSENTSAQRWQGDHASAKPIFGRSELVSRGRHKGLCTLSKVSKTWGFGVGHLKTICKDAFSVAGAVQKTCSWEMLGGQGADFLRGVAFWSIRSVGLLRWFCVTGAALLMTWHQFFVAGAVL